MSADVGAPSTSWQWGTHAKRGRRLWARNPFCETIAYFTWRLLDSAHGGSQPGLLHVNSLGYRGEELAREKGDAIRIPGRRR